MKTDLFNLFESFVAHEDSLKLVKAERARLVKDLEAVQRLNLPDLELLYLQQIKYYNDVLKGV